MLYVVLCYMNERQWLLSLLALMSVCSKKVTKKHVNLRMQKLRLKDALPPSTHLLNFIIVEKDVLPGGSQGLSLTFKLALREVHLHWGIHIFVKSLLNMAEYGWPPADPYDMVAVAMCATLEARS